MKKVRLLFVLFFAFVSCKQHAQNFYDRDGITMLPLPTNPELFIPLRELSDLHFQNDLRLIINQNAKWKRLVAQKKMAVGVVDLSDPYHAKFASVNGNVMMYAASLPKIAILLATMDALEKKEIDDSPELRYAMRQMISKSSNTAATELMDLIGFDKIESVLTDPAYELYDVVYGGGLWVGKRYAKSGSRYPDPLKGISHGATVSQVCRFYYMMAFGKLVSFDRSKEMLEYMDNPELNHKFINQLSVLAPQAHLYRKSGTWKTYHSDSVLVWGPERRYILVGLIDDPDGERILRELVLKVDNLLKKK